MFLKSLLQNNLSRAFAMKPTDIGSALKCHSSLDLIQGFEASQKSGDGLKGLILMGCEDS